VRFSTPKQLQYTPPAPPPKKKASTHLAAAAAGAAAAASAGAAAAAAAAGFGRLIGSGGLYSPISALLPLNALGAPTGFKKSHPASSPPRSGGSRLKSSGASRVATGSAGRSAMRAAVTIPSSASASACTSSSFFAVKVSRRGTLVLFCCGGLVWYVGLLVGKGV